MSQSPAKREPRLTSTNTPTEQPVAGRAQRAAPTGKMGAVLPEADEPDAGDYSVGDPVTRKTRLLSRKCDTCIYHPGNRMHLSPGRLKDITEEARATESYVICHETTPEGRLSSTVKPAVCQGFFERFSTNSLRIIGRLFGFLLVDPAAWATPNPASTGRAPVPVPATGLAPDLAVVSPGGAD